jgi:hypothetical protein
MMIISRIFLDAAQADIIRRRMITALGGILPDDPVVQHRAGPASDTGPQGSGRTYAEVAQPKPIVAQPNQAALPEHPATGDVPGPLRTVFVKGQRMEIPIGSTIDPKTGKIYQITPAKERSEEYRLLREEYETARRGVVQYMNAHGLVRDSVHGRTYDQKGQMIAYGQSPEYDRLVRRLTAAKAAYGLFRKQHPEMFQAQQPRRTGVRRRRNAPTAKTVYQTPQGVSRANAPDVNVFNVLQESEEIEDFNAESCTLNLKAL